MASSKLIVTAEVRPVTIQHFLDESFQVTYLPFNPSASATKDYEKALQGLADSLEEGEKYAIVGV